VGTSIAAAGPTSAMRCASGQNGQNLVTSAMPHAFRCPPPMAFTTARLSSVKPNSVRTGSQPVRRAAATSRGAVIVRAGDLVDTAKVRQLRSFTYTAAL
jgi:hypothetical protein